MENSIERVIMAINQTMTSPGLPHFKKDVLKDVRNSFEEFFKLCNSAKDNRIELFVQQLNRLLNNNNSFSFDFWTELQKDILYMLGKKNNPEKTVFGGSFYKRLKIEKELKQRELKFSENLQQFLNEHKQFFEVYLENCISFHSKLQVEKLFEDMTKFSEDFVDIENRISLQNKLNCINIEYDCTDRILYSFNFDHLRDKYSSRNIVEDINTYSLSKDPSNLHEEYSRVRFVDLLEKYRRIVILSDPGNSKTTILRWITYKFAQAAKNASQMVRFEGNHRSLVNIPVRIPILIRIGEFVTWLEQDQTKTLIDYIGAHTWFSKRYYSDEKNGQIVMKELISQGHALILLDGLDEISDTQQISNVIRCIENFIKEYVLSSDSISAFDEKFFDKMPRFAEIIESQLPTKSISNQIIITSRFTNYRFNSIMCPFIQHSLLPLIDHDDAKCLVDKWTKQILNSIIHILDAEKIKYDPEKIEKQSKKRDGIIKRIFKGKFNFLPSNSSLLFLITKSVFQSTEVTYLKRRIDIYRYHIEKDLYSWTKYNQTIPQDTITDFLTKLAFYLHLQSSSGLIDGFNIERLCSLTLKENNVSKDRRELRMYTENIIFWLKSNIGFATEIALNVYSFLHLSFQEYFVAMGFSDVEHYSIETIAQRMLSFTIYPRFRESLMLAMGLISSKLSQENYDQFCESLFTTTMNGYSIPFGILLFFDSIRDLYKRPSEKVLFQALNELFHHSCYSFSKKYFMSSLSKLYRIHLENWIQFCITDEKSLEKFLKLFLIEFDTCSDKYRLKVIYEKLRSFYDPNPSKEFVIDQILRRTSRTLFGPTFDENFSSYATSPSNIHPLIISIISGLFGDMQYSLREQSIDLKHFIKNIRVKSSVLDLICLHHFSNTNESHSVKIENFIREFQNKLDKSSSIDISLDIVETFIGLICLQGVSQPLIYEKYAHYKALPLALDKFKQTWFYFKQSFILSNTHNSFKSTFMSICSKTKSIMKNFSSHSRNIDVDCQPFAIACTSAWKKIGLYNYMERHENFDIQYHSKFIHLPSKEILYNIHEKRTFNENLLCFLPQSMQKLFSYKQLPLVVLLSQCLINLEYVIVENYYLFLAFPVLSRLLQDNKLENYALILFREKSTHMDNLIGEQMYFYNAMKKKGLLKYFLKNETKDYEKLITIERKRIKESRTDVEFFAASISLARIFQTQHRTRKDKLYDPINLNANKNQEIISSIKNISDPSLRIIAFSIILNMKDPLIFDEEQRNNLLQNEIIPLLNDLLPGCSLILLTFLFIQCYKLLQFFPESFQRMSHIINEKLSENPISREKRFEQEASYVALKQLNDSDLSHYLFKFEKTTKNLSDLLQFNSTIFHRYLTAIDSFNPSDQNLLSSMYFVELAFDCQILRMYTDINQNNILDLKQLWIDSSKTEKIMTYRVAQWIDNNLKKLDKQEIQQIIDDVSQCLKIERKALTIIARWLEYRKNRNLQFFAHYAALQLVIHDSGESVLVDIISEMLVTKRNLLKKRSFQENSFRSLLINSNNFGKVLFDLKKNNLFLSMISLTINQQDLLKIILDLELERIASTTSQSTRSFLLIIESISKDLQDYLIEHLQQPMIDTNITYKTAVIKRLIEISTSYRNYPEKLYDYILSDVFRNQQIPQIQKVILSSLYSAFLYNHMERQNIVFLEEILCSWITYEENVVDIALLVYGNYLLCFEEAQINENISKALENIHKHSFDRRFIRTSICLVVMKYSSRDYELIMTNLFDNREYAYNNEQKYKILLELTLYQFNKCIPVKETNDDENRISNTYILNEEIDTKDKICNYLIQHSDELLPIFIRDLYDFLCQNNDSSDLTSVNLIDIAVELIGKNLTGFLKTIKKSPYGEEKFRTQLEFYYQQNPNNRKISIIQLYTVFSVLTTEFLYMIEQFIDDNYGDEYNQLSFEFEQVSDRNVIEELFELILSNNTTDEKFRIYSNILLSIARHNQISLAEIHQKIKLVNNDLSDGDREEQILNILLNCCCINNDHKSMETKIFTKNDIEQVYRSDMEDIDKNSNLFSQAHYHFK